MHCCVVIETILIVDYAMSVLNKIIIFSYFKIWEWLQLGHTQSVGVVAFRASLGKIFRNHHWLGGNYQWMVSELFITKEKC